MPCRALSFCLPLKKISFLGKMESDVKEQGDKSGEVIYQLALVGKTTQWEDDDLLQKSYVSPDIEPHPTELRWEPKN